MKILNLIWGFSLGAGIDKCFLTYASLGTVDENVEVKSVCVNILNLNSHIEPLEEIGASLINIKSKKDISWIWKLNRYIHEEKPDVIFTHGFNGAIMMWIEKLLYRHRIKLTCSYHGTYHAPTFQKRALTPLYNALPIFIYKQYAHKVVCVENMSNRYLVAKGVPKNRVATVHNGIRDISDIVPMDLSDYSKGKISLITASRITSEKGLAYLLKALSIIKKEGIPFHYFVIGEGPDLDMLKNEAKELGLDDCVTFVGFQNNIPQWLAACDVFVLPSLHECHSIAVLEAMRAGKAIVATKVGGNGESISDGVDGLLVPAKDDRALSKALMRVIKSKELRISYGQNAYQHYLAEFTEDAMKKNLIEVLKS